MRVNCDGLGVVLCDGVFSLTEGTHLSESSSELFDGPFLMVSSYSFSVLVVGEQGHLLALTSPRECSCLRYLIPSSLRLPYIGEGNHPLSGNVH